MSIVNSTNRPLGEDPAAADLHTSEADRNNQKNQGPFVRTWFGGEGKKLENNATPLHVHLPGQAMIGVARSSFASASKVQLHPGAAAAAAAAATAIQNNAAAHVAFTAFTAQAARNAHAAHATSSVFRQSHASAAAAALLTQSNVSKKKHCVRGEQPRAVGASTTGASLGMSISDSLAGNSGSHGSNTRSRVTGNSGGGSHAGAAYCLIPQPTYDHDHPYRQQQQPPGPPQLSRVSNGSNSRSNGHIFVGPSKMAAGGGTPRSQDQQYQPRGVVGSAAATMMKMPSATATAVHRFRGGQVSSSSLMPGSHSSVSRLIDDARIGGGGLERSNSGLSAHVRLEKSREQNRQSSKKARVRRKGEEETLREQIQSIQLFRLIVEETPDMMSIHGLDHRAPFRYASSAFQRVAGINPRDVLGRGLTDLIAEEDCAAVQEALLKVVFAQTSDNIISYRMLTPAEGSLLVETSIRKGDQCIICVARAVRGKPSAPLQPPPPALSAATKEGKSGSIGVGNGGAADGSISGSGENSSSNINNNSNSVASAAAANTTTATTITTIHKNDSHNDGDTDSTSKPNKRDDGNDKGAGPSQGQTTAAVCAPPPPAPCKMRAV